MPASLDVFTRVVVGTPRADVSENTLGLFRFPPLDVQQRSAQAVAVRLFADVPVVGGIP